jgi:predicted alpha/beta-fold hydrolase
MTTSSSSEVLHRVAVPLLGVNARNDPFISPEALEHTVQRASINANVILVVTPAGGHIGWGEGLLSHLFRASWAERLTVDFLEAVRLVQERGGAGGIGGGPAGAAGAAGAEGGSAPRSRL